MYLLDATDPLWIRARPQQVLWGPTRLDCRVHRPCPLVRALRGSARWRPRALRSDRGAEAAGNRLTVSGERKERERVGILRRRTRTVGRFHYEVALPGQIERSRAPGAPDGDWLSSKAVSFLTLPLSLS